MTCPRCALPLRTSIRGCPGTPVSVCRKSDAIPDDYGEVSSPTTGRTRSTRGIESKSAALGTSWFGRTGRRSLHHGDGLDTAGPCQRRCFRCWYRSAAARVMTASRALAVAIGSGRNPSSAPDGAKTPVETVPLSVRIDTGDQSGPSAAADACSGSLTSGWGGGRRRAAFGAGGALLRPCPGQRDRCRPVPLRRGGPSGPGE